MKTATGGPSTAWTSRACILGTGVVAGLIILHCYDQHIDGVPARNHRLSFYIFITDFVRQKTAKLVAFGLLSPAISLGPYL